MPKFKLLQRLPAHVVNGISVAVGIGLVQLLVTLLVGPLAALAATSGAVVASLADQPLAPHRTWRRVLSAGLTGCAVILLALLLRPYPLMLGLAVALVGFVSALALAWGPRAGPLSFVGVLALVFTLATPAGLMPLGVQVGCSLLGATLYLGWAMLTSRLLQPRYRALALAEVLVATARLLRSRAALLAAEEAVPDNVSPLQAWIRDEAARDERVQAARDLLFAADATPQIQHQTERQNALLLLSIELRDTLMTSDLDLDLLGADAGALRVRQTLARHLHQVADALEAIHIALRLGQDFAPPAEASAELAALVATPPFGADDARARLTTALLERRRHMERVLARMQALMQGAELQLFVTVEGWPLAALRAQARLASPVLRHALRVGMALGNAYFIALALPWASHPYWLVLSVAVVLRGNLEQTLVRLNGRVAGTALGCLLVLGLAQLGLASLASAVFLVAVAVAHSFVIARYLVTATAATVMALVQAHMAHPAGGFATLERLADTLLGALLAWAFCYVLPAWERRGTAHLVGRLLRSLDVLAAEVLRWPEAAATTLALRLARREVYVMLGALAAAAQRSSAEPEQVRLPLHVCASLLMHSHTLLATRLDELERDAAQAALQQASAALHRQLDPVSVASSAEDGQTTSTLDAATLAARALPVQPAEQALLPWLERRLQLGGLAAARVAQAARVLIASTRV
jgi:uncharacterized membrane protein YccC